MTGSADAEADVPVEPEPEPERAYGCLVTDSLGQRVIHPERERWFEVAAALFDDGFNMCIDVTAVDFLTYAGKRTVPDGVEAERFELVASFISHHSRQRLRARIQVPVDDPSIASLYALYPGTDFLEREVFDLFGIDFVGHPDLSRILMPETWEGHPLRKDYDTGAIPVQFKGAPGPR
jgi:NADH-quinone oxidoreductase subunit C